MAAVDIKEINQKKYLEDIKRAIELSVKDVIFVPNTEGTRRNVEREIYTTLKGQFLEKYGN